MHHDVTKREIKFNQATHVGHEEKYLKEVLHSNWISGNGAFSKRVQEHIEAVYGFHMLPTHSCTAALEMAALLLDIGPGDDVLVPSFTFVTTASAFALRGGRLIFVDSHARFPNISLDQIKAAKTPSTKALVVVHYAGMALEIEAIRQWCDDEGVYLVEDAAQSIHARMLPTGTSTPRWVGSYGDLATFSFHETKNISSGQGGGLVINNSVFTDRAHTIWEKGTNRQLFMQGMVDKYGWVELGSSFLSSEFTNAVLLAQLEIAEQITESRLQIWEQYHAGLLPLEQAGYLQRMESPHGSGNNGHLYYFVLNSTYDRSQMIQWLAQRGIQVTFHYQPLEISPFVANNFGSQPKCEHSHRYAAQLIRLPLHLRLSREDVAYVIEKVHAFFNA